MELFKINFPSGYQVKNVDNDNLDVNIILEDNSVYFGTLFTIKNVQELLQISQESFFWATDMLIVQDLRIETIELAIEQTIVQGCFDHIFSKIGPVSKMHLS